MSRLPYLRSFRIVAEHGQIAAVEELLHAEGYEFEQEPFSPLCRRLIREPAPLGSSLAAFFGYIYIQDRSSMLPPLALSAQPGSAVLDMCASPGSKSGFLAQLVGKDGFVLANEPNPARLASLRGNLRVCNLLQAATCSFRGEQLPLENDTWPGILLDPPCSGWGTAVKNPSTLKIWQGEKIDKLVALQKKLLARAAGLLAPGGRLVYSTCTTNHAENEAQTEFAESALGLIREPLSPFPGFSYEERKGGKGCLLVHGAKSDAQGFYISLMRKPGIPERRTVQACNDFSGHILSGADLASPLFDSASLPDGNVAVFAEKLRFLPAASRGLIPAKLPWQGAYMGTAKGGLLRPDPRLRLVLPDPASQLDTPAIVVDEPGEIHAILEGQSRVYPVRWSHAALWWRDLPLGLVGLKKGRVTASFR